MKFYLYRKREKQNQSVNKRNWTSPTIDSRPLARLPPPQRTSETDADSFKGNETPRQGSQLNTGME
jgi:hypothetical protein